MTAASSHVTRVRRWIWLRPWPTAATILLAGLAIREVFSFWTGHPYDLEVWIRTGSVVAHGTNPYLGPIAQVPGVSFGYRNQLLYPAAYLPFWPGLFGGTFRLWEQVGGGNRFVLYFLLKQGPIAGDMAVAALLYRFVLRETGEPTTALGALTFWCFFPYDIVISAIWGQLDSVTTALVLLALLSSEAQSARRSLAWGLGIFVKWITVVFLPLEFFRHRGVRRLWPVASVVLVGGLTVLAFRLAGWSFTGIVATTTSSTGGGGGGMNYVQLTNLWFVANALNRVPSSYFVLQHAWVPVCIAAGWYTARWLGTGARGQQLRAFLFVLTAVLLVRWGLYEQYMLYPFALLAADVYTLHPERRRFFYFLVVVASGYLLVNNGAGIWFAAPTSQQAFNIVQGFDSSAFWGTVRYYLLDVFGVLMTVSLVQFLWVLARDDPNPRPWLIPPWPFLRRAAAPPSAVPVASAGP
ncbi:MAG: hypothetical protein L3K16_04840 [Thermoplasmata archaeon]|nr:hypothetical protein [Thermoplasmata archaeon]